MDPTHYEEFLELAVRMDNDEMVSLLLEDRMVQLDAAGCAFHAAVEIRNASYLTRMLDCGVSPNCRLEETGFTPLHSAAKANSHHVVNMLCKRGGDVAFVCNDSRTPYQVAKNYGNDKVMHALAACGSSTSMNSYKRAAELDPNGTLAKACEIFVANNYNKTNSNVFHSGDRMKPTCKCELLLHLPEADGLNEQCVFNVTYTYQIDLDLGDGQQKGKPTDKDGGRAKFGFPGQEDLQLVVMACVHREKLMKDASLGGWWVQGMLKKQPCFRDNLVMAWKADRFQLASV